MNYLHWEQITIDDLSDKNVSDMYENGYVFTRLGKGVMQQTRSVRVDLSKFELSSENRRILKKIEGIKCFQYPKLPLKPYDWGVGKLAKDFYENKFGPQILTANKVKEMLTDYKKSNFNLLLGFVSEKAHIGYSICFENKSLLHYSYPFYDLQSAPKDMGLGMMTLAIQWAKEQGKKYIYLGSLQRPSDTYKLQFSGLEWFDGGPHGNGKWSSDIAEVKKILTTTL